MRIGGMDMKLRFVRPGAPPPSTLLDGLVSYWALDEESGTRADSVGDNDLTDNNTVGYDTGKNGNAASFVAANYESLGRPGPDSASLWLAGTDFTISLWTKTTAADGTLVCSWDYGEYPNYGLDLLGGAPYFRYGDYRPGGANVLWGSAINDGTWHHVLVWNAESESKVYVCVDNGTPVSAATTAVLEALENEFRIGAIGPISFYDGLIEEVAVYSRVLTTDERAELYAAGAGKFYPFS